MQEHLEKIKELRRSLLGWFRANARDLPWRKTRDPFRIWVAEIMLQQTRVEAVIPYYERFFAMFPTVEALAEADEQALLVIWAGLGYYRRALNLHKAAQTLVKRTGGEGVQWPRTAEEWQKLPGVGRYTAAAIASIAFDQPVAVLDGNVKRVLARLFSVDEPIGSSEGDKLLWELAGTLLTPEAPGDHNQALMELGSRVCLPKHPRCDACPMRSYCLAFAEKRTSLLPKRVAKKPVPHRVAVAAWIEREGMLLLARRPDDGMLARLWELPGGLIEEGEKDEEALRNLLRERYGLRGEIGEQLCTVTHTYTHFTLTLRVYRVVPTRDLPAPFPEFLPFSWVSRDDRESFPIHRAHVKAIEAIENPQGRFLF